ncbi:putative Kinase [Melia azedarach]|uniref:Kinase n=1 Tax=Melia azedarach TaxID=155640 RepID=A0ACC1Y4S5_MELAZ|nr:putative Kinase [Melia azedarach]
MAFHILILLQIILLLSPIKASEPSCNRTCGDPYFAYPFGIGEGCYFDKNFEVACDNSSGSPKAFLTATGLELSSYTYYSGSRIAVNISVISLNRSKSTSNGRGVNLSGSPFSFSQELNRFTARGCRNLGMINTLKENNNSTTFGGCYAICTCDPTQSQNSSCCDFSCAIPPNLKFFHADIANNYSRNILQECTSLLMVYPYWLFSKYQTNSTVLEDEKQVPAVLEWGKHNGSCTEYFNSDNTRCDRDGYCIIQLDSGFVCLCNNNRSSSFQDICRGLLICNTTSGYNCSNCPHGYYLDYSSSNNDPECSPSKSLASFGKKSRVKYIVIGSISGGLGMLFLTIGTWWLYKFVKQRKETKRKQKFFRRNGGLLLQQEISSTNGNIEKTKVFTSKELEKATDNFNMNRILGQGGQGTVYKGMLADGKIVAIKRSKVMDESKVEEFINEVVILSQINHRNVVKLLGCCLETEVPLLVYEFVPNGNLFEYIHDQNQEFPITWEMRLRIAVEISGALSYLHSAASIPIYHRDIKTTNILLDDKYRAKVSDFGTSRSMAIDQTHMTTLVHGTFGYLDPEYFRSSQFTDKSDVYSFGVVLAELLTGEKPIRLINSEEDKSLVAYFLYAMKENRLFEILDARIIKEGRKDDIITVAELAKKCLNLNGKKRPTMKEVATELLGIRAWSEPLIMQESFKEDNYAESEVNSSRNFETGSSFTFSGSLSDSATFSVDVYPLISNGDERN